MREKMILTLSALLLAVTPGEVPAQEQCPETPSDLVAVLNQEEDAALREEASGCFVEKAIDFTYPDLKQLVHKMLKDSDSQEVRYYGLAILGASTLAEGTTGEDLADSKTKIIAILKEDPIARNKAAAAALIGEMDPIPENQVEQELLDLMSHEDSYLAEVAFDTLQRFLDPPREAMSNALVEGLGHVDPRHRAAAGKGLGQLYRKDQTVDPTIVGSLGLALGDNDDFVKLQAAHSLMLIGEPAASTVPELRKLAWDPKESPAVRQKAQEAEESLTGLPTRAPWAGDPPPPAPAGASGAP
jgi:hypothetical protein